MAIDQQITCNVCGIAKRQNNHWFVARVSAVGVCGIAFLPINDPIAHDPVPGVTVEHICGDTCMHKRLSQWLETFTAPPSERYVR